MTWMFAQAGEAAAFSDLKDCSGAGHTLRDCHRAGIHVTHSQSDRARFRSAFTEHYKPVWAFCARRTATASDADDVTATVFSVAWRQVDRLPVSDAEQRMWLFAIARKSLANHHRSDRRRRALTDRLSALADASLPGADDGIVDADELGRAIQALVTLRTSDQELLLFAIWEDLSVAEIAVVIGTSRPIVSVRLHRAKHRLRAAFDRLQGSTGTGHDRFRRAAGEAAEQESTG